MFAQLEIIAKLVIFAGAIALRCSTEGTPLWCARMAWEIHAEVFKIGKEKEQQ